MLLSSSLHLRLNSRGLSSPSPAEAHREQQIILTKVMPSPIDP